MDDKEATIAALRAVIAEALARSEDGAHSTETPAFTLIAVRTILRRAPQAAEPRTCSAEGEHRGPLVDAADGSGRVLCKEHWGITEPWTERWGLTRLEVPAVRRVAPDRETLKARAEKIFKSTKFRVATKDASLGGILVESSAVPYWDAVNAVANALASGVLGVPVDQRTADRETIARAVWDAQNPKYPWNELHADLPADHWRFDDAYEAADAVLAVLVPADQVRAEALEAWAATVRQEAEADERGLLDIPSGELPQGSRNMLNGVTRAAERANARAAEYRKGAGA